MRTHVEVKGNEESYKLCMTGSIVVIGGFIVGVHIFSSSSIILSKYPVDNGYTIQSKTPIINL